MLMQPTPGAEQIAFSERSLSVFGSTAVARGRLRLSLASGRVDQRFLRVYAKRDGRWQAVAVQTAPTVEPDGAG